MHHLKDNNGTLITDRVEIANTLGAAIAKSSSFGTFLSDKIYHQEGVPQGAILSTTLLNIKINDIVKQVDPGVECSLYVDDFVIMYRSPTTDAIQRKLQHTINRLEKLTIENGFTISKNETSNAFLSW